MTRPAEAEDQQVKPASRRLGDYWLIGCVLLALACFAVPWFNPAATQQAAETLCQKPIEQIQIDDRVLAVNPNGEVDRSLGDQIQPEAWRHLKLRLAKANGGTVQIELLRPLRWVQACQAKVGKTIQLDLPEMDAVGKAEVLSLGPCPEIVEGSGEVVTGTFAHEATEGNLLNVFVEGQPEPIGVTLHHPFWSETRGEFVAAEKLQPDEELRSREGDRLRVIQVLPRPGPERVYNLEVHRQHVYQIADAGIVVHNSSLGLVDHLSRPLRSNSSQSTPIILNRDGIPFRAAPRDLRNTNANILDHEGQPTTANPRNVSIKLGNRLAGSNWGGDAMRALGFDAHHIVPWDLDRPSQAPQRLRSLLLKNGISLQDIRYAPWNGVWLPGSRSGEQGKLRSSWPRSTWHKGSGPRTSKHSDASLRAIHDRLMRFDGDPRAIINEVQSIGREMQNGTFLNNAPCN